jgi:hypothetical protein
MRITRITCTRQRLPELFWGRWSVAWLDMRLATVIRIIEAAIVTTNMEAVMVGITTVMDIIDEVVTIEDTGIDDTRVIDPARISHKVPRTLG